MAKKKVACIEEEGTSHKSRKGKKHGKKGKSKKATSKR